MERPRFLATCCSQHSGRHAMRAASMWRNACCSLLKPSNANLLRAKRFEKLIGQSAGSGVDERADCPEHADRADQTENLQPGAGLMMTLDLPTLETRISAFVPAERESHGRRNQETMR